MFFFEILSAFGPRSRHERRRTQAPAVQITMEGVCIMLDEKPDWPTAKKVLGDSNFLNNLKNYDKDNIPEPTIKKLQKRAAASFDEPVRTASGPSRRWRRAPRSLHDHQRVSAPRESRAATVSVDAGTRRTRSPTRRRSRSIWGCSGRP